MGLAITTPAADTPISLAEAVLQSKIVSSADNALVTEDIEAATEAAQDVTGLQFVSATFTWTFDCFPASNVFAVPRSPMSAVTSIKYIDTDGVQQTWDAASYDKDFTSIPGRIALAFGESWPTIRGGAIDQVEVVFVAGYGDADDVPSHYKQAIVLIVADWYKNREDSTTGFSTSQIPWHAMRLLAQRGINWIG